MQWLPRCWWWFQTCVMARFSGESQLLYRDISNWNARRIRPLAQGTFLKSSRCAIYWPKFFRPIPLRRSLNCPAAGKISEKNHWPFQPPCHMIALTLHASPKDT
jgi:hypothetical protein